MNIRQSGPRWGQICVLLALTLAVAACNSDSSGSSSADGNTPTTTSSGVSYGRVTGFGSVFVNGTKFETNNAKIIVNGQTASLDDLSEGMLVRVKGQWNAQGGGSASHIEFDDNLRGPVTLVTGPDPVTGKGSLTVLGQTVLFDGRTVFRGKSAAKVAKGDAVSVSGWYLGNGKFRASLVNVGVSIGTDETELEGVIENLNRGTKTFTIGGLNVNYGSVTKVEFDDGQTQLNNGDYVEVEGRLQGADLLASEVEVDDDRIKADEGDDIELEGPIGDIAPDGSSFTINGIMIRLAGDTQFDDGLSKTSLQPGLWVKVEGNWNSAGEVVAEEIESREGDSEVNAKILAAPDTANMQLNIGGVTVQATSRTLIVDDGEGTAGQLKFSDLKKGDYVEVDGMLRTDAGGSVYLEALKIERDMDDDDAFELSGSVDSTTTTTFTILGIQMDVNDQTVYDGGLTGIADINAGDQLEVEYVGQAGGSFYLAREVEPEEEDDD